MRYLSLISLIALSACATTAPNDPAPGGVQTRALAAGDCGLFGWTTDEKREFIFYADSKEARYAGAKGPVDLTPETVFPAQDYLDPDGRLVQLRLGQGELMDGGMRYPGARIVTQTDEGWERLRPVAIVQSCQPKT